jgi:hypothetical protein
MPVDLYIHIFLELLLAVALLVLASAIRIEREVAADLKRAISRTALAISGRALRLKSLSSAMRNEMHAERGWPKVDE